MGLFSSTKKPANAWNSQKLIALQRILDTAISSGEISQADLLEIKRWNLLGRGDRAGGKQICQQLEAAIDNDQIGLSMMGGRRFS